MQYITCKRHGQFSGFQDLTFDLKMLRFPESLLLKVPIILDLERILFLTNNKIDLTFLVSNVELFLKSYNTFF